MKLNKLRDINPIVVILFVFSLSLVRIVFDFFNIPLPFKSFFHFLDFIQLFALLCMCYTVFFHDKCVEIENRFYEHLNGLAAEVRKLQSELQHEPRWCVLSVEIRPNWRNIITEMFPDLGGDVNVNDVVIKEHNIRPGIFSLEIELEKVWFMEAYHILYDYSSELEIVWCNYTARLTYPRSSRDEFYDRNEIGLTLKHPTSGEEMSVCILPYGIAFNVSGGRGAAPDYDRSALIPLHEIISFFRNPDRNLSTGEVIFPQGLRKKLDELGFNYSEDRRRRTCVTKYGSFFLNIDFLKRDRE